PSAPSTRPGFEATDRAFFAFHRYGAKKSRMSRDPAADAALTEFATASRTRLRNTAYLLCGDWDQAADHVQEGLIRVYVAWPRLVRGGGELAYARQAVVSAFLDASRKRSSRERPTDVSP